MKNGARYCSSYVEMNLTDNANKNASINYILLCAVKLSQRFHRDCKTFGLSLIFRYFPLALSLTDDVFVHTFYDFMTQGRGVSLVDLRMMTLVKILDHMQERYYCVCQTDCQTLR